MEQVHATTYFSADGHNITPTSGISLLPTFEDKKENGHEALFNKHFKSKSIREGVEI